MTEDLIYSGLVPGQMASVGYQSDGDDSISQCIPFNPFSLAFEHDKWVWGIVLCDTDGDPPDAIRPRRIYEGDNAIIVETIEGLCAYPEEVLQGNTSSGVVSICQSVIKQYSVERNDYYDGELVAHYWQHGWEYSGGELECDLSLVFNVPMEYIMWNENNIQEIIPPALTYTRTVHISLSVSSSNGSITNSSPTYNFPTPRCATGGLSCMQAGRF